MGKSLTSSRSSASRGRRSPNNRRQVASARVEREAPIPLTADESTIDNGSAWYVYLLPLFDCTAFKVGFSCNPLQRIFTFSRRYFERFDLDQALLLRTNNCDDARLVEAELKRALADHRVDSPGWVLPEAGGYTEWFSAVHFSDACGQLNRRSTASDPSSLLNGSDFIRATLAEFVGSFETWVCDQALRVCADANSVSLGYEPTISSASLRDWLDAYRYFDIAIFKDDPEALEFVTKSARRSV